MNINLTQLDDKAIFNIQVDPNTRRRKSKKIMLANSHVDDYLRKNYDLHGYQYLKNESDTHDLTIINTVGKFVFKKTNVDILKDNVKIENIKNKAESPIEEQKKEASLPYGLKKQTKTRRKKATKKTTEE